MGSYKSQIVFISTCTCIILPLYIISVCGDINFVYYKVGHDWNHGYLSEDDGISFKIKSKLHVGQDGVGSNIVQNHSSIASWKSYLFIICPISHEQLTKSEIR